VVAARNGSAVSDSAVGDFDNDGNLDFVGHQNDRVTVFLGDGAGGFTILEQSYGNTGRGLDAADFDHDGNLDLVRARYSSGDVSFLPGNGDGTFGAAVSLFDAGSDPYGVVAADFDGDGHPDLIVNNSSSGDANFFAGLGDGTFAAGVAVPSIDFNNYGSYDAHDYDGDGDQDLVAAGHTLRRIYYYPGNGDGTFGAQVEVGTTVTNTLGVASLPPGWSVLAPSADVTPLSQTVDVGVAAGFDGSGSAGAITGFEWDFGDGMTLPGAGAPGVAAHAYGAEGVYTARLRVDDAAARSNYAGAEVVVEGAAPVVDASDLDLDEGDAADGGWVASIDGAVRAGDDVAIAGYDWSWVALDTGFEVAGLLGWTSYAGVWAQDATDPIAGAGSLRQTDELLDRTDFLYDQPIDGDVRFSFDVRIDAGAGEEVHLLFAAQDTYELYELNIRGRGQNDVRLNRRAYSTSTRLDYNLEATHPSFPITIGGTYHVEASRFGDEIEFSIDGQTVGRMKDGTFAGGRFGFSTYRTAARFDNVRVERFGGDPVFTQSFGAGARDVTLTATDGARQVASGDITVRTTPGAAPTADPDGPYAADESAADHLGFRSTLDGTGSSDPEGSPLVYTWDTGTLTFDGTTVDTNRWVTFGPITQDDELVATATGGWGNVGAYTRHTYDRAEGLTFEATLEATGNTMVGWKNTGGSIQYAQLVYAIYLTGNNVYVYENGGNRGRKAYHQSGTPIDVRIVLKAGTGARYYVRRSGVGPYRLIYDSSHSGEATLRKGFDVNSGTLRVDDLRETWAGDAPTVTVYGLGPSPVDLTVTDPSGNSHTAGTVVTNSAGDPPVAGAGPDQVLGEADAVDAVWTASFDGGASTDDHGIGTYEWDFDYDGVTFEVDGAGQTIDKDYGVGVRDVALRVTDSAGQSDIDTLTVTTALGAPPVAEAAGPYVFDEITGNASAGGFTVTLDGTGSTDDTEVAHYAWDLGSDNFAGTSINAGKWATQNAAQNDAVTVTGLNDWDDSYLYSTTTVDRADGTAFEATVSASGDNMMLGWKLDNTNPHYGQYAYSLYFNGTNIYVYERGGSRGDTGYDVVAGNQYDVRIALRPTQGADYYIRANGDPDWIWLYGSSNYAEAAYRRGIVVYSGTATVHEMREIVGGATPSYTLFGLGARTVRLDVVDRVQQAHSDTATLTLQANDPPVAAAGADQSEDESTAFGGEWQLDFDGSGSSDDHGVYLYEWDFDYDGSFDVEGTGALVSHDFVGAGARTVALRVTDHALQSHLDTLQVTLTNGDAPVAEAGAEITTEGHWPVVLDGLGSTDDVEVERWEWDFGDGQLGWGPTPRHIYWGADGNYAVDLTVFDHAGQSNTDGTVVHVVTGDAPVANAGGPYVAGAGGPPAYLDGGASSDDYGVVKYLWDIDITDDSDGDGDPANDIDETGRRPMHIYPVEGVYTARLTVVDGRDQAHSANATVNIADNRAPSVVCVPGKVVDEANHPGLRFHPVLDGEATRIKCVARDAGALTYSVDFGDGSPPTAVAAVTNPFVIEETHTYSGAVNTVYRATISVWDGAALLGQDTYDVMISPDDLDTQVLIAKDEGLWRVHSIQERPAGSWTSYSSYRAGPTASPINAMLINGHVEDGDNQEDPYVETVNTGFDYLFGTLRQRAIAVTPAGNDPDSNGNGIGIEVNSGRPIYEGGLVMDAIAASNRPLGFARTGTADVKGRFYHHLLVDMSDAYAWGQVDTSTYRGGWRYSWNSGADNSACQWAAIGMQAAKDNFGINLPGWVHTENEIWLNRSYNGVGFGYTSPGDGPATTPSGLVQLAFDSIPTSDSRWRNVEDNIANNWLPQSNNYYGLFALVKALRLAQPFPVEVLSATGLDWYNDNATGVQRVIVDAQYGVGNSKWGGWRTGGHGGENLQTAWAIIMLTPTLFVQPPVAAAGDDIVWAYDQPLDFSHAGSFHADPERAIVKYEWDFDGDGSWDFETANRAQVATFTYPDPDPGTEGDPPQVFLARLRVTDDSTPPKTDIDVRQVTAAEPPHVPFARTGGPYRATAGIAFTLDGGASFDIDPGDRVTRFQWDLDDDGVFFDDVDVDTVLAATPWTFADPGTYFIGLEVWDAGAFNPLGCTVDIDCVPTKSLPDFATVLVEANLPPVADADGPYVLDEGTPGPLDGSGSSDPNGDPLTYAWDLDLDGVFDDAVGVAPMVQWPDDGVFPIELQVSDSLLDDVAATTVTVNNVAPTVLAGGDEVLPGVGTPFARAGSFTDPGADTWVGTVDWGEGAGPVALVLNPDKSFALAHTFARGGNFTVTVTVTDDDGGVGQATFDVLVTNTVPVVAAGPDGAIDEGSTFASAGAFVDPDVDAWSATVDYGDGTGVLPLALNPDKSFALSHTYADDGVFTVTVRVDDGSGVGLDVATVTVSNVDPSVDAGADVVLAGGAPLARSVSFTDPGADTWSATIDWGDGTPDDVRGSVTSPFDLNHAFDPGGPYTVTVTVTDDDGGVGADSFEVSIENTTPSLDLGPDASIDEGDDFVRAGSFTDPDPTDTWTATVDWGEGDGPEPLALNPDKTFDLNHPYAEDGTYTVTVRVTDNGGATGESSLEVVVGNVAPTVDAGADANVDEGSLLSRSLGLVDPGTEDTHTATVDWGDGGGPEGFAVAPDGTFDITHTYADDGDYTVRVTVADDEGDDSFDELVAHVANVAPTVDAGPDVSLAAGTPVGRDVTFGDPGADTHTATVDWGDGGAVEDLGAVVSPFGIAHAYGGNGPYDVTVTVTDDDGGVGVDTFRVSYENVLPVVDAGPDAAIDEGGAFVSAGSFADPNADAWTATVDYGDGGGAQALGLNPDKSFALNHVYADDGVYTVTVAVDDGSGSGSDTATVTVGNVAPSVDAGPDGAINLGDDFVSAGAFSDPGSDVWQVSVDWGDGTPAEVVAHAPDGSFPLAHTYAAAGNYVVTVTVTDDDGGVGQDTALVSVSVDDACPDDPDKTEPGVCGCGVPDAGDADGDGVLDCVDGCDDDPDKTEPGICGCGVADDDSDGDGTADCDDGCADDPDKTEAGVCGCGVPDDDSDGDGVLDCNDECPADVEKTDPGVCGCGVPDAGDADGDGVLDCVDGCVDDPDKVEPGVCGCGVPDDDSDGDGTLDCDDGCADDPDKTEAGVCGCGVADVDSDGDGTPDCIDECPDDPDDGCVEPPEEVCEEGQGACEGADWPWSHEISVAEAYNRLYGTAFDQHGECGLANLRGVHGFPMQAIFNTEMIAQIEMLAFDTSGTRPLNLIVIVGPGELATIELYDPGPWTPDSRGWLAGSRIDLAQVLVDNGLDPLAPFQLAVGNQPLNGANAIRLAGTEPGESLIGYNDGGVGAGDRDLNEPVFLAIGPEHMRLHDCPPGYNVIIGTDGDDYLRGTRRSDCIYGLGGDDLIRGRHDDDLLFGGRGDDDLRGGSGDDQLFGGAGHDWLRGHRGDDDLEGGAGDDELRGGLGWDALLGGDGDDDLRGGRGMDELFGECGNDGLRGGRGMDTLDGGHGDDDLRGGRSNDELDGGDGFDELRGNRGVDICINGEIVRSCE